MCGPGDAHVHAWVRSVVEHDSFITCRLSLKHFSRFITRSPTVRHLYSATFQNETQDLIQKTTEAFFSFRVGSSDENTPEWYLGSPEKDRLLGLQNWIKSLVPLHGCSSRIAPGHICTDHN